MNSIICRKFTFVVAMSLIAEYVAHADSESPSIPLAVSTQPAAVTDETYRQIDNALIKSREYKLPDQLKKVPVYPSSEDVKALAELGASRGRAAFMSLQQSSVEPTIPSDTVMPANTVNPVPTPLQASSGPEGLIVLAISSSMPEPMIRDYMAQLDGVPGVSVVLRGFIGGARTVAPTGSWIERVLRSDPSCRDCGHRNVHVVVDPLLFRSMSLTQVPAVAFLPRVRELKHCDGETFRTASVAYGAVSVEAALRSLKREGADIPRDALDRLTKASYGQDHH